MNVYILVYDSFAQFEAIMPAYIGSATGKVITVGINKEPVRSFEGFNILPDVTLSELVIEQVDVFIIPGGNPKVLIDNQKLKTLLITLDAHKKIIGGICAGVIGLANAGILEGKVFTTTVNEEEAIYINPDDCKDQNVVISEHIITAKPTGYVEFGLKLGQMMDIYEDQKDYEETVNFFMKFGNLESK